ncbi:MAG: RimK/LysX family protein [Proteobacteria bacterium]|nr:RimK/LysX family protein [Pseudomonadota bacterium]
MRSRKNLQPLVAGWREWAALPGLGIPRIKAKLDTGAQTSSVHATHMHDTVRDGVIWVQFMLAPMQRTAIGSVPCEAIVRDERIVRSSSGHTEHRIVIETPLVVGDRQKPVEIALTDRSDMSFRMLIGRSTLNRLKLLVDPGHSFLLSQDEED